MSFPPILLGSQIKETRNVAKCTFHPGLYAIDRLHGLLRIVALRHAVRSRLRLRNVLWAVLWPVCWRLRAGLRLSLPPSTRSARLVRLRTVLWRRLLWPLVRLL